MGQRENKKCATNISNELNKALPVSLKKEESGNC
jgi:hypothetical protein